MTVNSNREVAFSTRSKRQPRDEIMEELLVFSMRSLPKCTRSRPCVVSYALGSQIVQLGSCSEIGDSLRGSEAVNTEFEGPKMLKAKAD
jgi:hypothetical protein